MGKKKLKATEQLKRIAALPHNPYFHEEVVKLREKYAVPEDLREANDWLDSQLRKEVDISVETMGSLRGLLTSPTFSHGNATLKVIEMFALREHPRTYSAKLKKYSGESDWPYQTSLFKDISNLLKVFRLPIQMLYNVLRYISTGKKEWLDILEPWVKCEIDQTERIPEFRITVGGFIPWITKKQWIEIWNRCFVTESGHLFQSARKRATAKSFNEQMQRWAEWYQLSETQGLGPVEALKRWEEEHPDEYGKFDQSTVNHAVEDFHKIITPVHTED